MRESKKMPAMIPRLLQRFGVSGILENPVELVLVFNTTQKVYYTETKSTFKTFGTENNATFAVEKRKQIIYCGYRTKKAK